MLMTHRALTRRGYVLCKDQLTKDQQVEIIRDLTVKTTVLPAYADFMKPKIYRIFYHNSDCFFLPRYYAVEKFGPISVNKVAVGSPISIKLKWQPKPYQERCAQVMDENFDLQRYPDGNGGVISMPCGYGKTYLAIRTACKLGLKTLVVVNKEDLMNQWTKSIEKFTNATVGIIQQNRVETQADITVAMLHSLCLKDYDPTIFKSFGLLILDEVHHLASETFCQALLKVRPRFTLGLSATPERRDGLSHVFYKFIGPLLHKESRDNTNQVVVKQIKLKSTDSSYKVLYMKNGRTKNTSGMATAISQYRQRNQLIYEALKLLVHQGRTILVLSSRRGHLAELADLIERAPLRKSDGSQASYGFYYGAQGSNKAKHREMLEQSAQCDVILGTDAIAKEGLDIPSLNTLVFATPPGIDVEQAVGRILRKYHEQYYPMVVDIVDGCGNFPRHATERNKWYQEEKYQVQHAKLDLDSKSQLSTQAYTRLVGFLNNREAAPTLAPPSPVKAPAEPNFGQLLLFNNGSEKKKQKLTLKARAPKPTVSQVKERLYGKRPVDPIDQIDFCLLADPIPVKPPAPMAMPVTINSPRRFKVKSRLVVELF